jgi:hypothetical protein
LVVLTYEELKKISSMNSVIGVFELPSRMKLWPQLYNDSSYLRTPDAMIQHLIRRRAGLQPCEIIQLNVLLLAAVEDIPFLESEMDALCAETIFGIHSLCHVVSGSTSRRKLVVDTDECLRDLAAQRLAEHPAVTWVEVRPKMRLRNKYATRLLQSDNGSSWAVWDKGLRGDGEVSMLRLS